MKQENLEQSTGRQSLFRKMMPKDAATAFLFLAMAFFVAILVAHFLGQSSRKEPSPSSQAASVPASVYKTEPATTSAIGVTITDDEIRKGLAELGEVIAVEDAAPGLRRWRVKVRSASAQASGIPAETEMKVFQSGNWLFVGAAHRPDGELVDASLMTQEQVEAMRETSETEIKAEAATQTASQASSQPTEAQAETETDMSITEPWSGGELPPVYASLQQMHGVQTGPKDTNFADVVNIFFDPRCPWCKKAYATITQGWPKAAVRWLPVVVLGDQEAAWQSAASVLDEKNGAQNLARVMKGLAVDYKVDDATRQKIVENMQWLYGAVSAMDSSEQVGVPAMYWLSRNGQVGYAAGISDADGLRKVLGKEENKAKE